MMRGNFKGPTSPRCCRRVRPGYHKGFLSLGWRRLRAQGGTAGGLGVEKGILIIIDAVLLSYITAHMGLVSSTTT